ncbi:phage protease [Methylosinus sp. Sm6]|nr:phage protease [Methylosinus sp. Sm6]MBY6243987.1 phage protease [Methylosinus sp. Sm6]
MKTAPQAPDFCFHALAFALPGEAPEWITIFPSLGDIETRDRRKFSIDASVLMARFEKDGVVLPIDVNHATAIAARDGKAAPAVGWITQMRVEGGALQGKVDWLDEGKALLSAKSYRFVSPDFFHTADGAATWIRSVALVTAPALGNQPALASAHSQDRQEPSMKDIAAALGLSADASEASCLAALRDGYVPKKVHDETVSQLSIATTRLATIETEARKAKVDALIESALRDKKILPAEKDHYVSLCASDAGFESVSKLLAAKVVTLPASGLDRKAPPEGGADERPTPAQLSAKATKMVKDGEAPDFLTAVGILQDKHFADA